MALLIPLTRLLLRLISLRWSRELEYQGRLSVKDTAYIRLISVVLNKCKDILNGNMKHTKMVVSHCE